MNDRNHTHQPNQPFHFNEPEFNFIFPVNSLGYADKEWNKNKEKNNIRILTLGDSYTEGCGADYESSYPRVLEKKLRDKNYKVEIFNAGICGGDPEYNFNALEDIFLKFQPDIVIQSFTINDVYFDFLKKEQKRKLQEKYSPFVLDLILKLYSSNYIVKYSNAFFNFTLSPFNDQDLFIEYELSVQKRIKDIFHQYKKFCDVNQIDLVAFTFPLFFKNHETKTLDFYNKYSKILQSQNIFFYDLTECYSYYTKTSNQPLKNFYWEKDGHHNAKGYEMMAHCLEQILLPILEKSKGNKNTLLN